MAYGKKRTKRVNTNKAKYHKSASAQSTQICKLQKQVDRLNISTKDLMLTATFVINDSFKMGSGGLIGAAAPTGNLNSGLYCEELFKPGQLLPIFSTNNSFDTNSKVRVKYCRINATVGIIPQANPLQGAEDVAPRYIQVWVVSLKKETGKQLLVATNNLDQAELRLQETGTVFTKSPVLTYTVPGIPPNQPPVTASRDGNYFLNPNFFNIRSYKSFTIGNRTNSRTGAATAGHNMSDLSKNFSMKIKMNNVIKSASGATPWKTMTSSQLNTQDRLFMIVTCNGWNTLGQGLPNAPEQEVQMNTQSLFTIEGNE